MKHRPNCLAWYRNITLTLELLGPIVIGVRSPVIVVSDAQLVWLAHLPLWSGRQLTQAEPDLTQAQFTQMPLPLH